MLDVRAAHPERGTEDWRLHPAVVEALAKEIGNLETDLLATEANNRCGIYYTNAIHIAFV